MAPERDRRRLGRAIAAIEAHEVEGDLDAAVTLSLARLASQAGRRRVVVVSDMNLARPVTVRAREAIPIDVVRVGSAIDNAAIVHVDVRSGRAPDGGDEVQAFVRVANYGKAPRDLYVTMRQHNASDTLASRQVVVAAGASVPVVLRFTPAAADRGSGLLFELSPGDGLAVDDRAYARVPPGPELQVVIASATRSGEPSPWLVRAIRADADSDVSVTDVGALARATIDEDALVVVEGACPADTPGGPLVIVNPPPGPCFSATVGDAIDEPRITSWDESDPRLRFVGLDDVFVEKARLIAPEGGRALIKSERGVLAADASTPSRSVTLIGFDVGESNWPLKASFVLFTRNLLEQARAARAGKSGAPLATGEPLRLPLPAEVRAAKLTSPDGSSLELMPRGGLAVVPARGRAGLYLLEWSEPRAGVRPVAVSLASTTESNLAELDSIGESATEVGPAAGAAFELPRDRGWLWALAALALVVVDVAYLTRSSTRTRRQRAVRTRAAS
jgi:hypothetical protein